MQILMYMFQLANTLRFLAGLASLLVLAAATFKEIRPKEGEKGQRSASNATRSKVINLDNWRNPKYVLWAILVPSALFGYFVPYVHIVNL